MEVENPALRTKSSKKSSSRSSKNKKGAIVLEGKTGSSLTPVVLNGLHTTIAVEVDKETPPEDPIIYTSPPRSAKANNLSIVAGMRPLEDDQLVLDAAVVLDTEGNGDFEEDVIEGFAFASFLSQESLQEWVRQQEALRSSKSPPKDTQPLVRKPKVIRPRKPKENNRMKEVSGTITGGTTANSLQSSPKPRRPLSADGLCSNLPLSSGGLLGQNHRAERILCTCSGIKSEEKSFVCRCCSASTSSALTEDGIITSTNGLMAVKTTDEVEPAPAAMVPIPSRARSSSPPLRKIPRLDPAPTQGITVTAPVPTVLHNGNGPGRKLSPSNPRDAPKLASNTAQLANGDAGNHSKHGLKRAYDSGAYVPGLPSSHSVDLKPNHLTTGLGSLPPNFMQGLLPPTPFGGVQSAASAAFGAQLPFTFPASFPTFPGAVMSTLPTSAAAAAIAQQQGALIGGLPTAAGAASSAPFKQQQGPRGAPLQKKGKWCNMHVRIAWETHEHQKKGGNTLLTPSTQALPRASTSSSTSSGDAPPLKTTVSKAMPLSQPLPAAQSSQKTAPQVSPMHATLKAPSRGGATSSSAGLASTPTSNGLSGLSMLGSNGSALDALAKLGLYAGAIASNPSASSAYLPPTAPLPLALSGSTKYSMNDLPSHVSMQKMLDHKLATAAAAGGGASSMFPFGFASSSLGAGAESFDRMTLEKQRQLLMMGIVPNGLTQVSASSLVPLMNGYMDQHANRPPSRKTAGADSRSGAAGVLGADGLALRQMELDRQQQQQQHAVAAQQTQQLLMQQQAALMRAQQASMQQAATNRLMLPTAVDQQSLLQAAAVAAAAFPTVCSGAGLTVQGIPDFARAPQDFSRQQAQEWDRLMAQAAASASFLQPSPFPGATAQLGPRLDTFKLMPTGIPVSQYQTQALNHAALHPALFGSLLGQRMPTSPFASTLEQLARKNGGL